MKILISWLVLAGSVRALLFPEEAGVQDWNQRLFGSLVWSKASPDGRLIFGLSDRQAVGAIHAENGSTAWRSFISPEYRSRTVTLLPRLENTIARHPVSDELVVLSQKADAAVSPTLVQVFNAVSGQLLWSRHVGPATDAYGSKSIGFGVTNLPNGGLVVLFDQKRICHMHGWSGEVAWCTGPKSSSDSIVGVNFAGGKLFMVTRTSKEWVQVTELSESDGKPKDTTDCGGYCIGDDCRLVQKGDVLMFYDTYSSVLVTHQFSSSRSFSLNIKAEKLIDFHKADQKTVFALTKAATTAYTVLLIHLESQSFESWHTLDDVTYASLLQNGLLSAKNSESQYEVSLKYFETKKVQTFSAPFGLGRPGTVKWALPALKKNEAVVVLQTEDDFITAIKESTVVWQRHEALVNTTDVEFVELPERFLLQSHFIHDESKSSLRNFVERWGAHVKAMINSAMHWGKQGKIQLEGESDRSELLVRDKFGIRQMMVLAAGGRVYGILSDSGSVLWVTSLGTGSVSKIFITRPVHVQVPPMISVILKNEDGSTGIKTMNVLTGEIKHEDAEFVVKSAVRKVVPLHSFSNDQKQTVLAVVDINNKVHLYPGISLNLFTNTTQPETIIHTIDKQENRISACRLNLKVLACEETGVWSMDFGNEKILAVAEKQPYEHVASLGRVLGDRSVLYKYLNPNQLVVATVSPKNILKISLLDTVSGTILHQVQHTNFVPVNGTGVSKHSLPAVQIVQCENWVVYQFLGNQRRSIKETDAFDTLPEIHVLELFESDQPDGRIASEYISGYDAHLPSVQQQSYLAPGESTALGVTVTKSGVTSREILMIQEGQRILAYPKRYLDPRRPMKAPSALTAEEKEELLVPYQPVLEENPKEVVTYDLPLAGLNNVRTQPASLESTTLIFAYGHDLFFTRKMPSKSFDVLGDDFSRTGLLSIMIALALGIQITKRIVARRQLERDWK